MSTRRIEAVVAGVTFLGLVGTCDNEADGRAELLAFANEYARVSCQRIFSCCPEADRPAARFNFATEADCRMVFGRSVQNIGEVIEAGLVVFDPEEATRCLASIGSDSCSALFSPSGGFRPLCQNFVRGKGRNGAPCDNTDALCASNWCHQDVCAQRPACVRGGRCPAGQFCDASTDASTFACQPTRAQGEACGSSEGECGVGGRCRERQCAEALADGESCQLQSDCRGTCSNLASGTTMGTCRPALCQGMLP